MFFFKERKSNKKYGGTLVLLLVFSGIALYVTTAFVSWAGTSARSARHLIEREQAFHIAEAGIEYYRWFLAHSTVQPGEDPPVPTEPFIVKDKNDNEIGRAVFSITSPIPFSTVIQVESSGSVTGGGGVTRTIRATLAIPSFAKYSVASNSDVRLGEGTETFGEIHSNGGIRFDGHANNIVSSAKESYDDPDHYGPFEFGVHTHVSPVDPTPPASVPERTDVFAAGRVFPVPMVDFSGITQDLASIKSEAQDDGFYLTPSSQEGYLVELKTNDTFDVYEVESTMSMGSFFCSWGSNEGSLSVDEISFIGNYDIPDNGLIFVEDDTWIRGQIDGARVTVASGKFPATPSTHTSIITNEDLLYSNYDGTDAIALIAQEDISVGLYSNDDLIIDAALIAQNGRVGRPYYSTSCGSYTYRDSITVNGMIGSNKRYGFAYTNNTGYELRNLVYDANLRYAPPPNFPLTSDEYEILTWEEVE